MSISIPELDNTVRAFYEGKGDVVSFSPASQSPFVWRLPTFVSFPEANILSSTGQQKQAQQTLTEVTTSRQQMNDVESLKTD